MTATTTTPPQDPDPEPAAAATSRDLDPESTAAEDATVAAVLPEGMEGVETGKISEEEEVGDLEEDNNNDDDNNKEGGDGNGSNNISSNDNDLSIQDQVPKFRAAEEMEGLETGEIREGEVVKDLE